MRIVVTPEFRFYLFKRREQNGDNFPAGDFSLLKLL
jgi:hypothetical protein